MQGQSKRVVILLEVSVVKPGAEVGEKIGSPQAMGGDGSAKVQNQNANPNAGGGAPAVKRPSEQQVNYEAKKPLVTEQLRYEGFADICTIVIDMCLFGLYL